MKVAIDGRIRRFCRRKNKQNNGAETTHSPPLPICCLTLPYSLWITNVFPYLDRHSQNRLCAASRDVFDAKTLLKVEQPWPLGIVRIKKIVLAVAFSPRGDEIAFVTSNSREITITNRSSGHEQQHLRAHTGQCSNVSYAPSNEFLVSCSRIDGTVRLWRKDDQDEDELDRQKNYYYNFRVLSVQVFATLYVCVSPNNKDIASYGDDGRIYVSDAEDGRLLASTLWRSRLFIDCFKSVSFSSQREGVLAHSFNNQTVRLWNYRTQSIIELEDNDPTRMREYAEYVTSLQFVEMSTKSDSHEYLAVGCRVARVKIWDLADSTCLYEIHLGSGWSSVNELAFNNEGTRMACTGGGSNVRLFCIPQGECLARIEDHKGRIKTLAFSHDGRTLATGGSDRTLRLWDVP